MRVEITKRYTNTGKVKKYVTSVKDKKHLDNYINYLREVSNIWGEFSLIDYKVQQNE